MSSSRYQPIKDIYNWDPDFEDCLDSPVRGRFLIDIEMLDAPDVEVSGPGAETSGTLSRGDTTPDPEFITPVVSGSSTPAGLGSSTPPVTGSSTPADAGPSTPAHGSSTPSVQDSSTQDSSTQGSSTQDSSTQDSSTFVNTGSSILADTGPSTLPTSPGHITINPVPDQPTDERASAAEIATNVTAAVPDQSANERAFAAEIARNRFQARQRLKRRRENRTRKAKAKVSSRMERFVPGQQGNTGGQGDEGQRNDGYGGHAGNNGPENDGQQRNGGNATDRGKTVRFATTVEVKDFYKETAPSTTLMNQSRGAQLKWPVYSFSDMAGPVTEAAYPRMAVGPFFGPYGQWQPQQLPIDVEAFRTPKLPKDVATVVAGLIASGAIQGQVSQRINLDTGELQDVVTVTKSEDYLAVLAYCRALNA